MRDRGTQVTLGTFVATFVYAILALGSIAHGRKGDFVPHVSIDHGRGRPQGGPYRDPAGAFASYFLVKKSGLKPLQRNDFGYRGSPSSGPNVVMMASTPYARRD